MSDSHSASPQGIVQTGGCGHHLNIRSDYDAFLKDIDSPSAQEMVNEQGS